MAQFKWTTDLNAPNAISRGPSLPKETDRCIVAYDAARTRLRNAKSRKEADTAQADLEDLRYNIENRIEQLEDFYLKHDSESKAMLFEKQRLRLRRLLHSDVRTSSPSRASPARSAPASASKVAIDYDASTAPIPRRERSGARLIVRMLNGKRIPVDVGPGGSLDDVRERVEASEGIPRDQQTFMHGDIVVDEDMNLSSLPDGSVLKLQRPAPKMAYSTNTSPRDKFARGVNRRRTKDRKKVAPIYDWETSESKPIKDHMQYKLEGEFEFQIKLTTKEFFKLTSRRRAIGAEKRHLERTGAQSVKESPYLQSDGPYVDPMRISGSIYRSPRKDLWIDPKGLRPYQHV